MPNPGVTANSQNNTDSGRNETHEPATQPIEEKLQKALDKALYGGGRPGAQKIRNFLNGTWLGEPLHVVLTDVPIGAWTSAMVFDALDLILRRSEFEVAADTSIAIGLAGSSRCSNYRPDRLVGC